MRCDQNINLLERFLEVLFEIFEKLFGRSIVGRNHFDLYDVVNKLNATILPGSLIRR